jgi:hypothetical protein
MPFAIIPVAESSASVGVNGISVTPTNLDDLLEQTTVNLSTTVPISESFTSIGVNGISVTPTNLDDLLEQTTVNLSTTVPISEILTLINIAGITASPTYVYTDGAPIAAPEPSQQTTEQWSIT